MDSPTIPDLAAMGATPAGQGARLRWARERAGLSERQAGALFCCRSCAIRVLMAEDGNHPLPPADLDKAGDTYGVSTAFLADGTLRPLSEVRLCIDGAPTERDREEAIAFLRTLRVG